MIIYSLAIIFSSFYCKFFLHLKVRGRRNLRKIKGGFFIYGNHTQPVGDVFTPALCVLPRRVYTVVSTANYGIPFIGKILPYLGALPTVRTLHGLRELSRAMETRLAQGHPIVVYPETHVWEYFTKIRPFPEASFKFPVKPDVPSVAMTVTYRRSKLFRKPVMEVFLDGPYYGEGETARMKAADLHDKIYSVMCERSRNSDFEYIRYEKRPE